MKMPHVFDTLKLRGYTFSSIAAFSVESIAEDPGVYVVLVSEEGLARTVAVREVTTPWLRTDIIAFLGTDAAIAARPTMVAFRVMDQLDGEHSREHLARIADERRQIAETLKWPL